MPTCPCCGDSLPASAEQGEVCPDCNRAFERPDEIQKQDSPEQRLLTELAEKAAKQSSLAVAETMHVWYPVTWALLAANIGLYLLLWFITDKWPSADRFTWGMMDWGPFTLGGQWWRLFTSTFVHGGAEHLAANMLFLWVFGKRSERLFGKNNFLGLYISCSLAGSIASIAWHAEKLSYGASAGVAGLSGALIGAYGMLGRKLSTGYRWKLLLLVVFTAFALYPDKNVNNAAHVSGLIVGLVLGVLLSPYREQNKRLATRKVYASVAVVLITSYISLMFINRYSVPLKAAIRAANAGNEQEAVKQVNVALQSNPGSMLANTLAAEEYLKLGDYRRADASARKAVSIDGYDDHALYVLGAVELRSGRCQEAHQIANRIIDHVIMNDQHGWEARAWSLFVQPCLPQPQKE